LSLYCILKSWYNMKILNPKILTYAILLITFSSSQVFAQNVKYVDSSVTTSGNGNSWGTALKTLTEALDSAHKNPSIDSILVSKGTYTPGNLPYNMNSSRIGNTIASTGDQRVQTFHIRAGLEVYGGYPSGGGNRNWKSNKTILSGGISSFDTAYHVVLMDSTGAWGQTNDTSILDGFTVTHGSGITIDSSVVNYSRIWDDRGNAIYIDSGTHKIVHCEISNNSCYGVYYANAGLFSNRADLTVLECQIKDNYAYSQHASFKSIPVNIAIPGLYTTGGKFVLENCEFTNNKAEAYNANSNTFAGVQTTAVTSIIAEGSTSLDNRIVNCNFINNQAINRTPGHSFVAISVGGVYLNYIHATYQGCVFENNESILYDTVSTSFRSNTRSVCAGAVGHFSSVVDINGCIFNQNGAEGYSKASAVYAAGTGYHQNLLGLFTPPSILKITNSTIYADTGFAQTAAGSAYSGGAFFIRDDTASINNTLIWATDGEAIGHPFAASVVSGDTVLNENNGKFGVKNSLLYAYSGACDSCLIHQSPVFSDSMNPEGADGQYRTTDDGLNLSSASPAIDKGSLAALPSGLTLDLVGNARIQGISVDIGAYESVGNTCLLSSPITSVSGTYYAKSSGSDSTFICYCDSLGNLLLALDTNGTGAEISPDSVSLEIGAQTVSKYTSAGGIITNSSGGAVFNRKWDVRPTIQPTSPVTVKYYFTDQEYSAIKDTLAGMSTTLTSPAQLQMYKITSGGRFVNPNGSGVTGIIMLGGSTPSESVWVYDSLDANKFCATYLVGSFSGGGGGGGAGGVPLPVELISFEARAISNLSALLTWETASEENNSHFELYRSYDGKSFERIQITPGAGTSYERNFYSVLDKEIEPGKSVAYYKLKQIDFDGASSWSETRSVRFIETGISNPSNVVYPNPSSGVIHVQVADEVTYSLKNGQGQEVLVGALSKNSNAMDLSGLNSGMYILEIKGVTESSQVRVIKW
jgi:hypothetical protein